MCYRIAVLMAIFLGAVPSIVSPAIGDEKPKMLEVNTGLAKDLLLLRKTVTLPQDPPVRASSGDACKAAARIFARLKFIGMSKEHVFWILGDPATISDYGFEAEEKADAPLIYRFASGFGGNDYQIEFKNGRVTHVKKIGVN